MPPSQKIETRPSGVTGLVRRHPLTAFLLWFFTVGQAIAFVPVVAQPYGTDLDAQLFVVASTLVGLLLPAVVITRIVDGPDGARELWRRSLAVGVGLRWYALALVAAPALAVALAIVFFGAPADLSASTVLSALVFGLLLQTVVALVPNNWAEEVAWMGFFQARLQDRHGSALRAALLTGPLFALMHLPLVVGNGVVGALLMLGLIAVAIPFRAVMGWAYNCTGSLFLVGFMHAASNGVAGGGGFGDGFLRQMYPGQDFVTLMHLVAFAVLGPVVIAATRGRLGRAVPGGRGMTERARSPFSAAPAGIATSSARKERP